MQAAVRRRRRRTITIIPTAGHGKSDHAEHRNAKDRTQADGREESNDGSGAAHSASSRARTDQGHVLPLGGHVANPNSEGTMGSASPGVRTSSAIPRGEERKTVMDHS